jgi:hypothetical protein
MIKTKSTNPGSLILEVASEILTGTMDGSLPGLLAGSAWRRSPGVQSLKFESKQTCHPDRSLPRICGEAEGSARE